MTTADAAPQPPHIRAARSGLHLVAALPALVALPVALITSVLCRAARRLAILWVLYFVQGLPFGFQATALPVYLREAGVSLTGIGLVTALALVIAAVFAQLVRLPASLVVLVSPARAAVDAARRAGAAAALRG